MEVGEWRGPGTEDGLLGGPVVLSRWDSRAPTVVQWVRPQGRSLVRENGWSSRLGLLKSESQYFRMNLGSPWVLDSVKRGF